MATVYYSLKGFRREEHLNNYMIGIGTDAYEDKIEVALKLETNMIVIGYLADKNELLEVRYSPNLESYYSSLSLSQMQEIAERNSYWIMKEIVSSKLSTFKYSEKQLDDALVDAVPLEPKNAERIVPKTPSKAQVIANTENYKYLYDLALNKDAETISAIKKLCKALLEANVAVVSIYNQQIFYNKAKNLTAADYLQMLQRIKKISKNLNVFLSKDFKNADEVIDYVNKNYVDPSATGEATKFVINYPFEKLNYQKRKQILLLFLDGNRKLSFSGFLAGATWDGSREISGGDIIFNLLNTGSEADRAKLITELEKETKIFDLLNQADSDDFLFNITAIISKIGLMLNSVEDKEDLVVDLLKKGNFIYFEIALAKDQRENLQAKPKKIQLENNGAYNLAGSFAGTYKAYEAYQELIEEYKQQFSSLKTLFDPLELVVLFAENDINTQIIKLQKGDSVILPACVVYLLFKEDTNRAVNFLVALSTTVIFLPLGVSGLIAAIEAASGLGVFVAATDIAVDAAYLTYTSPDIQNSDLREDLEWINTVVAIYGLARLSYSLKDFKGVQLTKDIYKAFTQLAKEADIFIKKLPYDIVVGIINKLGKDVQYILLNRLLVSFANDGKVLFKMNAEGILVEMKLVTNAANYIVISEVKNAKIKVEKLGGKVFEEHVQLSKITIDNKPVLRLATPFKEGKQRPSEIINQFFERSKDLAPCKEGLKVIDRFLESSEEVFIIAETGNNSFGGWATSKIFKTEIEARDALSLLQKFKKHKIGLEIRKYKPKPTVKIPVRESKAGPIEETEGIWKGKTYKGGAKQYQFLEFYRDIDFAEDFFIKIDPSILLK